MKSPIFTLPDFSIKKVHTKDIVDESSNWYINYLQLDKLKIFGEGVKIAVLDSGVDPCHFDLRANIVQKCDFTGSKYKWEDHYSGNGGEGHGTHVLNLITARVNSIGTRGVAPGSSIYVGKVIGDDNMVREAHLVEGLEWALNNEVDLINLSLRTHDFSESVKRLVDRAEAEGVIVICAAGNNVRNNDPLDFPARLDNALAIGAIENECSLLWDGSPVSDQVDFVAPGVYLRSYRTDREEVQVQGTSFAAACCTGIIALYLESLSKSKTPRHSTNFNIDEWKKALVQRAFKTPMRQVGLGYGSLLPMNFVK